MEATGCCSGWDMMSFLSPTHDQILFIDMGRGTKLMKDTRTKDLVYFLFFRLCIFFSPSPPPPPTSRLMAPNRGGDAQHPTQLRYESPVSESGGFGRELATPEIKKKQTRFFFPPKNITPRNPSPAIYLGPPLFPSLSRPTAFPPYLSRPTAFPYLSRTHRFFPQK